MDENVQIIICFNAFLNDLKGAISLLQEILLNKNMRELKAEKVKMLVILRSGMDENLKLLVNRAVERNSLFCLTQLLNTLNALDNCIWEAEKEFIPHAFQESIEDLRYDISILIQLSEHILDTL